MSIDDLVDAEGNVSNEKYYAFMESHGVPRAVVDAVSDYQESVNLMLAGLFRLANTEMEQAEKDEIMDHICPLKFQHFSSGQLKYAAENASLTDF